MAYPGHVQDLSDDRIAAALRDVHLGNLVGRLDERADWAKILSPGEQQRIAFARVLLIRPQVVFLDEATSAVDEGLEYSLYQMIRDRVPDSILFSVSHRSTVDPAPHPPARTARGRALAPVRGQRRLRHPHRKGPFVRPGRTNGPFAQVCITGTVRTTATLPGPTRPAHPRRPESVPRGNCCAADGTTVSAPGAGAELQATVVAVSVFADQFPPLSHCATASQSPEAAWAVPVLTTRGAATRRGGGGEAAEQACDGLRIDGVLSVLMVRVPAGAARRAPTVRSLTSALEVAISDPAGSPTGESGSAAGSFGSSRDRR